MKYHNIRIIDDDEAFLDFMKHWFQKNYGIQVTTYSNCNSFISNLEEDSTIDLVLIDVRLKNENGLRLSKKVREINNHCKIIHLSSLDGSSIFEEDYIILNKPISTDELKNVIAA